MERNSEEMLLSDLFVFFNIEKLEFTLTIYSG